MTNYELYINGVLCDLSADEAITLRYQSPIFSGLDIIQSNRSYEIRLPLTSRNRKAIGFAERLDIDAEEPYKRLPAALYQEGVPLFETGYAVIIEISDVISAVLTWGNVDNFQPLFDANLQELGKQLGSNNVIGWDENTKIVAGSTGPLTIYPAVGFYGVDFGMGLSNPKYLHPSVSVVAILGAIERYNGITIEGKERLAKSHDLPLILPLVTKNSGPDSWYSDRFEASSAHYGNSFSEHAGLKFREIVSDKRSILTDQNYAFDVSSTKTIDVSIISYDSSVFFPGMKPAAMAMTPALTLRGDSKNGTSEVLLSVEGIDTGFGIRFGVRPDLFNNVEVNVEDYNTVRWILINAVTIDPLTDKEYTVAAKFIITPHFNDIQFPSPFPIAENLPDMTQGEFVLTFMSMFGLFAYPDRESPNTIKFISIEDILGSQDSTIDWSDKVLLNDGHDVSRPESSVFTLADFAQRNLLDYDNDDDVKADTHGIITVRNENIEKETDLVELPFSASENTTTGGVNCALVPLYEKRDNTEDEPAYSECSPRILAVHNDQSYNGGAICTGRFESWMKFGGEEGLLATYYGGYQRVVDRIRLVTLRAKLTALDLMQLDYTKPIYISQFGQAFALYSVETGEDGICDCELIHLRGFQPIIPATDNNG